ncbi:MAG TPA: peptidylprolyl isomerase [Candidatus Paenibacillus intestinavium]|nr:peptidylprolyl isomerase [Candidatus Paenibacillus intestinavium]
MDNKETQSSGVSSNQEVAGNEAVTSNQAMASTSGVLTSAAPVKGGSNPIWMIAAIVLAIVLVVVMVFPSGGKSTTIASVNGTKITKETFFDNFQELSSADVNSILDNMITEEVLHQEAKAKNITLTDKDVTDEIAAMKLDIGTDEAFNSFLANYGMTEDDLKKQLETSVLLRLLLQSTITVTDEQAEAYFEENIATLGGTPEQVRASHILVADKATADDLVAQLKDGADFAELATANSTDQGSAAAGGDLGFFAHEAMIPEFSEAAFALEIDELSEPIQSTFGYHIIKKTGHNPETVVTFDMIKDSIKIKLINEAVYPNISTYIEELKTKAKVTNNLTPAAEVGTPVE